MVKATEGFVVYHAAIGQRALPDHFNFGSDVSNFMVLNAKEKDPQLWSRLIKLFSHPGDWVLDINIPQGIIHRDIAHFIVHCNIDASRRATRRAR